MKKMEWFKDDSEREKLKPLLENIEINKDDQESTQIPLEPDPDEEAPLEKNNDDLLEEEIALKQSIDAYATFIKEYETWDQEKFDETGKQAVRELFRTLIIEPFQKLFKRFKLEEQAQNKEIDEYEKKAQAHKAQPGDFKRQLAYIKPKSDSLKTRTQYWKQEFEKISHEVRKHFHDIDFNLLDNLN